MKMMIIACYLFLVTMSGWVVGNFLTAGQAHASVPIARFTENGCKTFCNGSPVVSYNTTCIGDFGAECQIEGMSVVTTCLGTYDSIITPELKVSTTCDGLYFNYGNGTTPSGETFEEGNDCGGYISMQYSVDSKDSILPSTPVNKNCKGTYSAGAAEHNVLPREGNCTEMCNHEEYDGYVCNGDYELKCDVESASFTYDCTGVWVNKELSAACIGYGKLVVLNKNTVTTEICTKSMVFTAEDDTTEKVVCQGDFSVEFSSTPEKTNFPWF